jgi:hypothetical protein
VFKETISLDDLMSSAAGAKKLGLVILDACRNDPLFDNVRQASVPGRAGVWHRAGLPRSSR